MIPEILHSGKIREGQSVAFVIHSGKIPNLLNLSDTQSDYARRLLSEEDDVITINTYNRIVFLVRANRKKDSASRYEGFRRAGMAIVRELKKDKRTSLAVISENKNDPYLVNLAEGILLGRYQYNRFRNEAKSDSYSEYPEEITLVGARENDMNWLKSMTRAVYFARDLVNEPSNSLTATKLAEKAKEFAGESGVRVETFGKRKIEALKMGGLMAVNMGSPEPPTFTVLEWKPSDAVNRKPVVLVGKGVVFDTGGLNLKPTNYIEDMKSDMAGGAVVVATISLLAMMKTPLHVVALVPATDNRPGMNAIAPGDIITMLNGKTVEVLNTDAEGRLILADALSYAGRFDPELVVSVATLTGSAANAFGSQAIAAMGNAAKKYVKQLCKAGQNSYERVALMPFFNEYGEMMKSDIADFKNIGEKEAGAITAGKFLENFVDAPYLHLDIAGVSILKKDDYYRRKGGTGTGIRLLTGFLVSLTESK